MVRKFGSNLKESHLEKTFLLQVRVLGLPIPEREFRFFPKRRWRADFAWPDQKLLVEIEGGVFSVGRHNRPMGFIKDCEKYNYAVLLGYRLLRFAPPHVTSGDAINCVCLALGEKTKVNDLELLKIEEETDE